MGFPSFPPSGRVVSLMEALEFMGTGGYNRRVSFRTARRYFISRMFSYVGRCVGPTMLITSALRRSKTSGWSERRNMANVRVEAVVSRPAMRMFKISSRRMFLSVVSCKRESNSVLLSLSVSPASVRAACLAKPSSRIGFRKLLITSACGSDLSLSVH